MDREQALKLLRGGKDGITEWNRRRQEGEEVPDLSDVSLGGADMRKADLNNIKMAYANLIEANLVSADFTAADLANADLCGANLMAADLTGAIFSDANLSGTELFCAQLLGTILSNSQLRDARLHFSIFDGSDLSGADFAGANLRATIFANTDLSQARSLSKVNHDGPSTLGIDTILKSGGSIPQAFLEGCGVPNDWIKHLPSLLGKPIDFYSCFISYSHQDEEFSTRLHSRMREDNLRVWYAPEDMKAGRKIHEQIDAAIRLHDKLLVVLSEHSMQSEWVANEIREAFKREKQEGGRVLFPISLVPFKQIENWKLIDSRTGTDLAEEIRQYYIPDFTNWKDHDAFEATYQRLMKDFKPAPDDK